MSKQMETSTLGHKSSGVVLKDITKIFQQPDTGKDFVAVDHINLNIQDGEMVTLLGPSGCGKTTTLRMISGFEYPTSGSVFIGERDVAKVPPNKRGISMVFQSYALFPHLNIWENVAYGLKVEKLPQDEIVRRTNAVMELMQLTGMERRFPNQLSGGQQQRVALARAVVIEPSVLLFDEPLSNLDAKLRESMRDELRALQKRLGITSLYVTHDQSEAMAISDRVVIMKDGVICQQGSPTEIYEQPGSRFVANFIGKANFIDGTFRGMDGESALVEVNGHTFPIPAPGRMEGVRKDGPCCLTVRPESCPSLRGGGAPARRHLPGHLLRRQGGVRGHAGRPAHHRGGLQSPADQALCRGRPGPHDAGGPLRAGAGVRRHAAQSENTERARAVKPGSSVCRSTRKFWETGRKIATKETQEGCLSFSINRFSERFKVLKNAGSLSKRLFRQAEGPGCKARALF